VTVPEAVVVLVKLTDAEADVVADGDQVAEGVMDDELDKDGDDVKELVALGEMVGLAVGDGLADVQLPDPLLLVVPTGHAVHTVAPGPLYVPAAQGDVTMAWVRGRQKLPGPAVHTPPQEVQEKDWDVRAGSEATSVGTSPAKALSQRSMDLHITNHSTTTQSTTG
jgi:hypothetical protein